MVYGWIFVVNVNIKVQKLIKINVHKKGSGTMKLKYKVYEFDCNKYITNIDIDTCYIVTYYGDVNSEIKKYIGEKLDF